MAQTEMNTNPQNIEIIKNLINSLTLCENAFRKIDGDLNPRLFSLKRTKEPTEKNIEFFKEASKDLNNKFKILDDSDVPFSDEIEDKINEIKNSVMAIIIAIENKEFESLDIPEIIKFIFDEKLKIVRYYSKQGYKHIYDVK